GERGEPEFLVESAGRGVEVVPAGADGHDFCATGLQARDRVFDERPADAAPTAVGRDCQEVDLAVTLSGPEDPADESHDPFVDFGDGGIPTVFRGMQTGEVATVVLSPVTVPVGEDDVTDERAERVLVERFESVDRQLEKDREVLGCERTDVHGGSLSAESVKREPSFRDAMASLTA